MKSYQYNSKSVVKNQVSFKEVYSECQFVQREKSLKQDVIREEQTGRWLLQILLSVQSAASLWCLIEYARAVDHTARKRSLL